MMRSAMRSLSVRSSRRSRSRSSPPTSRTSGLTTSRRLNMQQLAGERGGALGGARRSPRRRRATGWSAGSSRVAKPTQVRITDEQVVEVVGHAAGELADALQALRLGQAVLELGALLGAAAALGDVGRDGDRPPRRRPSTSRSGNLTMRKVRSSSPVGLGDDHHRLVGLAVLGDAIVDVEVRRAGARRAASPPRCARTAWSAGTPKSSSQRRLTSR